MTEQREPLGPTGTRPSGISSGEWLESATLAARRQQQSSMERCAALYWRVNERLRAERGPSRSTIAIAAASAALALSAALFLLLSAIPSMREVPASALSASALPIGPQVPESLLVSPDLGTIESGAAHSFSFQEMDEERRLEFAEGILRAQIVPQDLARPVTIKTPHLKLVVLGTRFDVTVTPSQTTVSLFEGHLRIERGDRSLVLSPGHSISSDDPALIPSAVAPRPALRAAQERPRTPSRALAKQVEKQISPMDTAILGAPERTAPSPLSRCESMAQLEERLSCLAPIARGADLTAQSALYLRALLERDGGDLAGSLTAAREFKERFPSSLLAPEVALLELELFRRTKRRLKAISAADEFERQFPGDPRAVEVKALKEKLLLEESVD